jgi:hypothetical protein
MQQPTAAAMAAGSLPGSAGLSAGSAAASLGGKGPAALDWKQPMEI